MDLDNLNKGFRQIFLFIHVTGSPNYWHEPVLWSPYVSNVTIQRISYVIDFISLIFLASELSAYITQRNLDFQQMTFLFVCCNGHGSCTLACLSLVYYKDIVKVLVRELLVESPGRHYNEDVGAVALKQTRMYVMATAGLFILTNIFYGVESIVMLLKDGVFGIILTAWPQVDDYRLIANIGRIIAYVTSTVWVFRYSGTLATVFTVTLSARYQYKQVQSYFQSLVNVFHENSLSQREKEIKYENGLKYGFMMHSKILNCSKDVAAICLVTFGAQILLNVTVFVIMMCRIFVGDSKPFTAVLPDMISIMIVLITTGCYMTTLGNLTIEAANVRDAMYCSGWENCGRASAVRVRKLLGVGMAQTQNPLIISLLGVFPVSHASYVSIVKTSYSIFSLMYSLNN